MSLNVTSLLTVATPPAPTDIVVMAAVVFAATVNGPNAATWAVYTLGGSALAAGATYCLKTQMDKGRLLVGRSMGAFMMGIFGSRLAALYYPQITELANDPILLVLLGIAFGAVGYAVAYPVINLLDRISPSLARKFFKRAGFEDPGDEPPQPPTHQAKPHPKLPHVTPRRPGPPRGKDKDGDKDGDEDPSSSP